MRSNNAVFFFLLSVSSVLCVSTVDFDLSMEKEQHLEVFQKSGVFPLWFAFLKNLYQKNNFDAVCPQAACKIPKIIHQIWLGGEFPQEYIPYRQSWIDYHPDWLFVLWVDAPHLYTGRQVNSFEQVARWIDDPDSDRFLIVDVNNLNFENKLFFDAAKNYGERSDILRWEAVFRFGGVYVDTDFECLKPLDELHYRYDFYTGIQPLDTRHVQLGAALFGAVARHPILQRCVENIKHNRNIPQIVLKTGPFYFTKLFIQAADKNGLKDIAFPASYFYPMAYNQNGMSESVWFKPEAYAVHHWEGSWLKPEAFAQ